MRTNLLEFLFGETVIRDEAELGEQIVRLFEEADEAEGIELVANKKPLGSALSAMGVSGKVEAGVQWAELHCDNDADYRNYVGILSEPDNMHKLAEMGWVMARCGDAAMSSEPPDYKIGFIEIQTAESGDADKSNENINAIIKKGQEFATTPVEQDDDLNPVEHEHGKPDAKLSGKTTGIGKSSDGADPEGKPKGSTKSESIVDRLLAKPVQEMTGTGSCGTFSGGVPPVMAQTGLRPKKRRMKPTGKASDAMRP